jgi:hypothetical protein
VAGEEHDHHRMQDGILLPAPTAWPLFTALGITLLLAGLVTNVTVSAVGLVLALRGTVGWWRAVLPEEQTTLARYQPAEERAPAVAPRPQVVEHLVVGEDRHRVRVPVEMQPYTSGLWGGLAGGVAMAAVAVVYGLLAEGSPWYPINLLAAAVLPSLAAAAPEQLRFFHGAGLLAASVMHGGLSLLVGVVYAAILPMLPGRIFLWGGIVAPLVWSGVAWVSLDIVNPALNRHIDWGWFFASQVAFGLAAGWAIARIEPIRTVQKWPLAARAGIEARGVGSEKDGDT